MRNRVFTIDFETKSGVKSISGLNCTFSVSKSFQASMNEAQIAIDGLTTEDINYLTTINTFQNGQQQRKKIRITSGYEDNASLIFSGEIKEALPTSPPDRTLQITAYSGQNAKLLPLNKVAKNTTSSQVAQEIASDIGLTLVNNAKTVNITSFYSVGVGYDAIEALNRIKGITAFVDDEKLYLYNSDYSGSRTAIFSIESGLIGQPQVTTYGCDITVLMYPKLKSGDIFEVKSSTIPLANGLYQAMKLTHAGQSRGNDWYTKIEGRRE